MSSTVGVEALEQVSSTDYKVTPSKQCSSRSTRRERGHSGGSTFCMFGICLMLLSHMCEQEAIPTCRQLGIK
jgi:hypothetical protein